MRGRRYKYIQIYANRATYKWGHPLAVFVRKRGGSFNLRTPDQRPELFTFLGTGGGVSRHFPSHFGGVQEGIYAFFYSLGKYGHIEGQFGY